MRAQSTRRAVLAGGCAAGSASEDSPADGYLYPVVLVTSFVGAYAIDNNFFSVWLVFCFGVVGYAMKRFELPMAPLVVGVVIGALFEKALVQSSALLDGNLWLVVTKPIAVVILLLAALLAVGPTLARRVRTALARPAPDEESHV
jgi:putative tricarboxylic transport membrane protein